MAGRASSTPRMAEWMELATDLEDNLTEAAKHLSIGRVSDLTGLADSTIADTLTRKAITHEDNPRRAICRPDYRVGRIPLWSQEQVDDYKRIMRGKTYDDDNLDTVTPQGAKDRGLVTTAEIRERLDVHDQTLRRYQRSSSTYPKPVARLSREGSPGVPEHLREWNAVVAWAMVQPGITVPRKWRVKEAS